MKRRSNLAAIPFFDTFYAVYTLTILAALFLVGALDGTLQGTLLALYQLPLAYLAFHNNPIIDLLHSPSPVPDPNDSDDSDDPRFDQRG